MKIKKYKVKFQVGKVNILDSQYDLQDEFIENDLRVIAIMDNEIRLLLHGEKGIRYSILLDSKDICQLMNWWMGQEEYKDNQRRHEEKQSKPDLDSLNIPDVIKQEYRALKAEIIDLKNSDYRKMSEEEYETHKLNLSEKKERMETLQGNLLVAGISEEYLFRD